MTDTKYYNQASTFGPLFTKWGAVFDTGVPLRLAVSWMLQDAPNFIWPKPYPSYPIILRGKEYPFVQGLNYIVPRETGYYTPADWADHFSAALQASTKPVKLSALQWFELLQGFGANVYNQMPGSKASKTFDEWAEQLDEFNRKVQFTQTLFNTIQTIVTVKVLTTLPLPDGPLQDLQTSIKGVTDEIVNIDNAVEVVKNIAIDTMNDKVSLMRNDILRGIRELDDQTVLNLSALETQVADLSRQVMNAMDTAAGQAITAMFTALQNKLSVADTALLEPQSLEGQAVREHEKELALWNALGLKQVFFRRVT